MAVTELAIGYEYARIMNSGTVFKARCGYEWQLWHDYSSSYSEGTEVDDPIGTFNGPADVGFSGFTFLAGLEF